MGNCCPCLENQGHEYTPIPSCQEIAEANHSAGMPVLRRITGNSSSSTLAAGTGSPLAFSPRDKSAQVSTLDGKTTLKPPSKRSSSQADGIYSDVEQSATYKPLQEYTNSASKTITSKASAFQMKTPSPLPTQPTQSEPSIVHNEVTDILSPNVSKPDSTSADFCEVSSTVHISPATDNRSSIIAIARSESIRRDQAPVIDAPAALSARDGLVSREEGAIEIASDSADKSVDMSHVTTVETAPVHSMPIGYIFCSLCSQALPKSSFSVKQQSKSRGKTPPNAKCKACVAMLT